MPYDVFALAQQLRSIGVPVSTQEIRDTSAAIGLLEPERALGALKAALVKSAEARRALHTLAPLFATGHDAPAGDDIVAARLRSMDDTELHDFVREVLVRRDRHGLSIAATELIDRHVTIQHGAPVAGSVHVLRAYRAAQPERLREELTRAFDYAAPDPLVSLRERLWHDEVERRLEDLKHHLETEIRRRLVHDRGAHSVAEAIRVGLPGDVDFLTASTKQIHEMSSVLETLPSRLERQMRLADARPPGGRLDVRRTVRSSMSTGGVPVRPVFHPRTPPKPDLVILADISGSVASFARFTLALTHGLHARFHSVRSFVFVDGVDEVTDLLRNSTDLQHSATQIDDRQLGVHLDGRSDYGRTFRRFWTIFGEQLSPRTIVLVLGDGRGNYRSAEEAAFRAIARRAGRLFWLNPENSATWSDGDSLIDTYRPYCRGVFEIRTVRQLEDFVRRHAT